MRKLRKYKGGQLDCVICNCCGKKLVVREIHRFDLCEECYDAVISQFAIPAEVEENTELL